MCIVIGHESATLCKCITRGHLVSRKKALQSTWRKLFIGGDQFWWNNYTEHAGCITKQNIHKVAHSKTGGIKDKTADCTERTAAAAAGASWLRRPADITHGCWSESDCCTDLGNNSVLIRRIWQCWACNHTCVWATPAASLDTAGNLRSTWSHHTWLLVQTYWLTNLPTVKQLSSWKCD